MQLRDWVHFLDNSGAFCLFCFFFNYLFFGFAVSSLLHKGFPLVAVDRGYSLIAMHGLLIVVPSLVVEHQLSAFSCCGAPALGCTGSVAVAHRLSCPVACGI